jgi:hypothetical protein
VTAAPVPELRWLTTPEDVPPALRLALANCWRDVANSGGAVGFAQRLPATDALVAPAVDELVRGLSTPGDRLLAATRGTALAGSC